MLGWLPGIVLLTALVVGCDDQPRAAAVPAAGTPAPTAGMARIEGVLSDRARPVAGATVTLTAYADDACADLTDAGTSTQAERAQLAACALDVWEVTTDPAGRFVFENVAPEVYRVALFWEHTAGRSVGLGSATMQQVGVWLIRYGHARTIDGRWADFAQARTATLHLAAGDVLTLDLAHVPPR